LVISPEGSYIHGTSTIFNLKFYIRNYATLSLQPTSKRVKYLVEVGISIIDLKLPLEPYLVSMEQICLPISIEYNYGVTYLGKKKGFSKYPYLIIMMWFFREY